MTELIEVEAAMFCSWKKLIRSKKSSSLGFNFINFNSQAYKSFISTVIPGQLVTKRGSLINLTRRTFESPDIFHVTCVFQGVSLTLSTFPTEIKTQGGNHFAGIVTHGLG
jgi:hypothetical protein